MGSSLSVNTEILGDGGEVIGRDVAQHYRSFRDLALIACHFVTSSGLSVAV
jgi:hypothetical protein